MLIVTNSESTFSPVLETDETCALIAWGDPLHFGRVSPELDLAIFARSRAQVFSSFGWDEDKVVEADFTLRNDALQFAVDDEAEILLAFGPSVKDQLSLAQIATWLGLQHSSAIGRTRVIGSENPIESLEGDAVEAEMRKARPISIETIAVYRSFWMAYASSDPRFLQSFDIDAAKEKVPGELSSAARRILCEHPSAENGLSLTEAQILDAVHLGVSSPQELFESYQETETYPYLSSWEFWSVLHRLSSGLEPLLKVKGRNKFLCPPRDLAWTAFYEQEVGLTPKGKQLMNGESHLAELHFPSRWIGGALLKQGDCWLWDYERRILTKEARQVIGV